MAMKKLEGKKFSGRRTDWQAVGGWYEDLVGEKGHYYQRQVVIPKTLELLELRDGDKLLDLGCGEGVLARHLPFSVEYWGVDGAVNLVKAAREKDGNPKHQYLVGDITGEVGNLPGEMDRVVVMLAIQNVKHPDRVIAFASRKLKRGGELVIVMNHPMFRIPRLSGWGIREGSKQQYRWVARYMSRQSIPIKVHPGSRQSVVAWSFHEPLANYVGYLTKESMVVMGLNEWVSDKTSVGKAGKMENLARAEIPMFMAIRARKE